MPSLPSLQAGQAAPAIGLAWQGEGGTHGQLAPPRLPVCSIIVWHMHYTRHTSGRQPGRQSFTGSASAYHGSCGCMHAPLERASCSLQPCMTARLRWQVVVVVAGWRR